MAMELSLDAILALDRTKKILILAGVLVLLTALYVWALFLPAHRQIEQLDKKLSGLDAAAKVTLLLGTVITVNLCWLLSGAALTRFFHDPTISRAINLIFAGLLIASVAITLLV